MTKTALAERIPSGDDLTDEEIVGRVLGGEAALFEVIVRRYNQRLYRVARSIVRDAAEAEDVMQDAYVDAYVHLAQFRGLAKFSTWLTKIAVHAALARVRRLRVVRTARSPEEESVMDGAESRSPDPEQGASAAELRGLLESAIEALPPPYRSTFVLRDVEGLDTADTAECLGIKSDAVKTRLHRARTMLREDLLQRAGLTAATAFPFHLTRCDRVVAGVLDRLGITAGG